MLIIVSLQSRGTVKKLENWKQIGNTNVDKENSLELFKLTRVIAGIEKKIKSVFEATGIWFMNVDCWVKPIVANEVIFISYI